MIDLDLFDNVISTDKRLKAITEPPKGYSDFCRIIIDSDKAITILKKIEQWEYCVLDTETTGLRPYREGHSIFSISFSNGHISYAMPFYDKIPEFKTAIKRLLKSKVKFICHNGKFDAMWLYVFSGIWLNLHWDTMIGHHCISNQDRCGLKYLVQKQFGVIYNDGLEQYLEGTKEEVEKYGHNAFNLLKEIKENAKITYKDSIWNSILMYNALDSLFTYRLFQHQQKFIDAFMEKGRSFFTEASIFLVKMEHQGLDCDIELCKKVSEQMKDKMDVLEKEVNIELKKDIKEIMGNTEHGQLLKNYDKSEFSMSNSNDLAYLVYDCMGIKPTEFTEKGKPKADKESMMNFKIPLIEKVFEWRKLARARTTYIHNFMSVTVNRKIHPNFSLHNVSSFRGACSDPNLQNIPKRDKEIMNFVRSVLLPEKGCKIAEFDYKSVEVSIGACVHLDPTMIAYICDETSDMHRDTAGELFIKDPKEVTKDERQIAKNSFVFPSFYGSYWKLTAPDIWDKISKETKEHLRQKGITSYAKFEKHVEKIDNSFWKERFCDYNQWRYDVFNKYEKTGKVILKTGFYCTGLMNRKDCGNYPIQGSAFHVLLWTLMETIKELERRGLKSRPMIQIHDAMVFNLFPEEEEEIDSIIKEIGTVKVREYWKWIIVPLTIEKSVTGIDESWAKIKEIGKL